MAEVDHVVRPVAAQNELWPEGMLESVDGQGCGGQDLFWDNHPAKRLQPGLTAPLTQKLRKPPVQSVGHLRALIFQPAPDFLAG